VSEARHRNLHLSIPSGIREVPGEGIAGKINGREVIVGGLKFVSRLLVSDHLQSPVSEYSKGTVVVAVAVDGRLAGFVVLADELRTGTKILLEKIKALGIERIVLATGDRREVAESVTKDLALDAVRSELTADQKVLIVLSERKAGPVMMVGDGINDAPALAAADVGVAMGANGPAASAEAADVVLLVDRLEPIASAIEIAHYSRYIAFESVLVGLGCSVAGMIAAAMGYLTPVQGALLQEVVDVVVILNALRVLREPRTN
jgi:P-type E1-E2 ATPase